MAGRWPTITIAPCRPGLLPVIVQCNRSAPRMNADAVARMQQSLMTIKTAAVRIQKQDHTLVEVVSEILDAVHEVERELLAASAEVGIPEAVPTARGRRTATKAKEYYTEKVGGGETLSEGRLD